MPTAVGYADCSYELRQTGLSRPAYITFGVDPSGSDPSAVASSVRGAFNAAGSLKTLFDSTVTMTATRVSMGTDGGGDLVGVVTGSDAGTNTMEALPPNCAVLIHKNTARGGRRGRGRMYLPWTIAEGTVSEAGIVSSSFVTIHETALLAWKTALSTAAVPLGGCSTDRAGTFHRFRTRSRR